MAPRPTVPPHPTAGNARVTGPLPLLTDPLARPRSVRATEPRRARLEAKEDVMSRRITITALTALTLAAGAQAAQAAGGSATGYGPALKALEIRSRALDRAYHLGDYAARSQTTAADRAL